MRLIAFLAVVMRCSNTINKKSGGGRSASPARKTTYVEHLGTDTTSKVVSHVLTYACIFVCTYVKIVLAHAK